MLERVSARCLRPEFKRGLRGGRGEGFVEQRHVVHDWKCWTGCSYAAWVVTFADKPYG
jgi:hypothetical protein